MEKEDQLRVGEETDRARDGGTSNAPLVSRHCHNNRPSTVVSQGHMLYVRFRTDNSIPKTGFKAKYSIGKQKLVRHYTKETNNNLECCQNFIISLFDIRAYFR